MKTAVLRTCLVAAFVGCSAAAFAAVGELSCTTIAGEATFAGPVTYYDIGLAPAAATGGETGKGGGRVTFKPVDLHLPLADFLTFVRPAAEGAVFSECKLTTQDGKKSIQYDFRHATFASIDAVSDEGAEGRPGAFSYTDLKLDFLSLEIQASKAPPTILR